ncbi:MAG: prepilin-type N-terminal cleavage/methylation domain-containing protein [Pseudomonadota bacterium]
MRIKRTSDKDPHHPLPELGFTLIEMVITILISSILAMGVVNYIADSSIGFLESANRSRLASGGRTALDRMTMELHNALPNSVRVNVAAPNGDQCLEFVPAIKATTYINPSFSGSGSASFQVVDFNPLTTYASPAGIYAVIYPIDTDELYDYDDNRGPLALVDEVSDPNGADGVMTIDLDEAHRFERRSTAQRLFLVEQPVSFCVVGDKLYRYSDYTYTATQCDPSSCLPAILPDRAVFADNIDNAGLTAFSMSDATRRRNAVVSFDVNMSSQGDNVRLNHEVLIHNVP